MAVSIAQFVLMAAAAILLPQAGLLIVLSLVVLLPWTMARARRTADDAVAPLGLANTWLPSSVLLPRVGTGASATTRSDRRLSRGEAMAGRWWSTPTRAAARSWSRPPPPATRCMAATVGSPLTPAPRAVTGFVAALPADRRWNRASVEAGPDGIRVDRRGSTLDQGFLRDLWLGERLAEISARPSSAA